MQPWKRIPARYYLRLCEVMDRLGVDPATLLSQTGLRLSDVARTGASLSADQVEQVVEAAIRATGRTDLGLETAKTLKLTSHSAVSYGILSSPTAGYALRLVARFFSLILPPFRLQYRLTGERMELAINPAWAMSHHCLVFHLDLISASVHWELRELLGGTMPPYRIEFALSEPPHIERYHQLQEATVRFGWDAQLGVSMSWPAALAEQATDLADPQALKLAEQRCRELLNSARATGDVAAWVSMMLRESRGAPPSREELADSLGLSSRTLDRYLAREGAAFRQLSRQAMLEKAQGLLRDSPMPVTGIALELGYADAANFTRAFRREAGCSPQAWRRRSTDQ